MFRYFISLLFFPAFFFGASWAEETLAKMTLREKIGQLFIAPACPLREVKHREDWVHLMKTYHIGGAIMKQSDLDAHVRFVNCLQETSKLPLLITADAEWGLGMRISDAISFPRNEILGKIGDLDLIREIGFEIGKACKRVGIHLNFAPVADINTNPDNPVIGSRSFGSDPQQVSSCVIAMLEGMERGGVMSCAKHFPGHGDTAVDSHLDMPILLHNLERIQKIELSSFRAAIKGGVSAIMSAHILIPCLDEKFPCTLSFHVMQKLLREEMGFQGLIVTDALNMKALSHFYSTEEIASHAHFAGCDLLLYGDHKAPNVDDILHNQIPAAYHHLLEAYELGEADLKGLDEKVLRILRAKEAMQLHLEKQVQIAGVKASLDTPEVLVLQEKIKSKSGLR